MNNIFPIIILIWIISAIVKAAKNSTEKADSTRKKSAATKQMSQKPGNFMEMKEARPVYHMNKSESNNRTEAGKLNQPSETMFQKQPKRDYLKRPDGKPARIARGMYPGDQPPQGMKLVYCPYCNAENLVPTDGNRDYHCYFCWVKLEGGGSL